MIHTTHTKIELRLVLHFICKQDETMKKLSSSFGFCKIVTFSELIVRKFIALSMLLK
jgi:hypothetical protein